MAGYCCAQSTEVHRAVAPRGKRIPFNFPGIVLSPDATPVPLRWDALHSHAPTPARLRVTCALDTREERIIEVALAGDGETIGRFDLRYAYALQPFELCLNRAEALAAAAQGVVLRMTKGTQPTFLFDRCPEPFLSPHLIFDGDFTNPREAFYDRLYSPASIQPFGWLEGCVLDGMVTALKKRPAGGGANPLALHLSSYLPAGRLIYEDPRSNIADGGIYGIEAGLPFAIMAQQRQYSQATRVFLDFVFGIEGEAVTDSEFLSAEGAYTVAYPLASIAASLKDERLARLAVRELMIRKERLLDKGDLYLRKADSQLLFKNWGRAYVWFLLGTVQTLHILTREGIPYPAELADTLRQTARKAAALMPDGLAPVFLGEPETGIDTSASAGIAAAFLLGCRCGLLDPEFALLAERSRSALMHYLTPDGLLGGCAQSNKGGEALQRGGYRVISQMAMGLLAHIM